VQPQDPLESKNKEDSQQQPQPTTTAADLILHYLEQIGVEYVFGIPGGGIEPFYNALARSQRRGGPRAVIARHETGAAFMADGYARESGKLGVCCATTGPGATNMITGVASAYMDHIPLLAITAQTSLKTFGRGAAQESSCTGVNTVGMYQYCTRYNTLVSHVDQLERKLISAITTAMHPPYGPAHLSIPIDVLRTPVDIDPSINAHALLTPSYAVDEEAVNQLHRTLYNAHNIVFVLGAGAHKATNVILELATLLNAHVITTPDGKGLVDSFHPQYRGVCGLAGHSTAHNLLKSKSIDAVLAIGTNLNEEATNGWEYSSLPTNKLVFIDSSSLYFSRAPIARHCISGNIAGTFERLLTRFKDTHKEVNNFDQPLIQDHSFNDVPVIPFERRSNGRRQNHSSNIFKGVSYIKERRQVQDRRYTSNPPPAVRRFTLKDEEKYLSEAVPIKPQRLMYDLSRLCPPNTRFLADIGNSFLWVIHYLHVFNKNAISSQLPSTGMIRLGMGFSPMGWAIGASIGTALASHGNPVVCITGDGALLMSGQELNTAVQERLPVIFVVLNDASYGTVKHGQQMAGAELIGFDLPPVDFVAYAKAMGAEAFLIRSPQDMAELRITPICKRAGPTVLDVHIDPVEIPPLEERINTLRTDMCS
jgi:acetolactate synthase-1/2/3 large subunit